MGQEGLGGLVKLWSKLNDFLRFSDGLARLAGVIDWEDGGGPSYREKEEWATGRGGGASN